MAFSRSFLRTEGKDIVPIVAYFLPQGTGQPTTPDLATGIKSITRSGVGTFLIAFASVYREFFGAVGMVQAAAATDLYPQAGTFTQGSSAQYPGAGTPSTLVVRLLTAAVATDLAANANNSVTVVAWFRAGSSNLK